MFRLLLPDEHPSTGLLDKPGAFAWWYADALDANGDGFVLIASYTLPFAPGVGSAWRAGTSGPARDRPSMNVAWYEGYRPVGYWLEEYEARVGQFGPCRMTRSPGRVRFDVDLFTPGSSDRTVGHFDIVGPEYAGSDRKVTSEGKDHGWAPVLGPCTATASLTTGSSTRTFVGPAYADRNHGEHPLTGIGLSRWTWARGTFEDETRVLYALEGSDGVARSYGVRIDRQGRAQVFEGRAEHAGRTGMWGTARTSRLIVDGEVFLETEATRCIDAAPFYARSLGVMRANGQTAPMITELCHPDRIDRAWMRPFVRMAVHDTVAGPSMWLPLFQGLRHDRWARLLSRTPPALPESP